MMRLKKDYYLAKCCLPQEGDEIIGFLKFGSTTVSIHQAGCANLDKVEPARLVTLTWSEIKDESEIVDLLKDKIYLKLDADDFKVLAHHRKMGCDYAAVVAKATLIDRKTVFDCHRKLRDAGLIVRVQPKMIQYRKNIVKNKWIKHRNHTYYEITDKGINYLEYYESSISGEV